MNSHRSAIRLLKGERRLLIACKPAAYTLPVTYLSGLSSPEVVAQSKSAPLLHMVRGWQYVIGQSSPISECEPGQISLLR